MPQLRKQHGLQLIALVASAAALVSSACETRRAEPSREEEAPSDTRELPPVGAPPLPVAESKPILQATSTPSASVTSGTSGAIARDAGPGLYAFDFEDAGLPELVRLVSVITGKRFLVTGKLPTITASSHSPEPITAEEAYQAFLTILHTNGLTLVRRGKVEVVVTEASLLGR